MKNALTGQRFGALRVLGPTPDRKHGAVIWRCICDCGDEILLESRKLKTGLVKSCGCMDMPLPRDLTGMRFQKLTVEGKTGEKAKNRSVIWRCRCDCGGVVETTRDKLLSGNVGSCGCGRMPPLKDWVGKRFGSLVVEEYAGKEQGSHLWRCHCDCGGTVTARQSNLQDGCTTSCGCRHDPRKVMHFVEGTCVEQLRSKTISAANTSGVRGVYFNKKRNKWVAQIMFKGKTYYLGAFTKLEDAAKARWLGEEKIFDDFLRWYEEEYPGSQQHGA